MKPQVKLKGVVLIILVLLAIISVGYIFSMTQQNSKPIPTPKALNVPDWNMVIPGTSTEQEVVNTLGTPKGKVGDVSNYPSRNLAIDSQIYYQKEVVGLIKETVGYSEKRNIDEISSKYGVAPNMLYGPDAVNGYFLFVYPTNGIAYLGNPNTKSLLEVWYFQPTTIDDFLNKWGSGYSLKPQRSGF